MTTFFFLAAVLSELLPSSVTYYVDLFENSSLTHSYRVETEENQLWEFRELFPDGSEDFSFIVEQSDYVGHIYTIIQGSGSKSYSVNLQDVLAEYVPIAEEHSQRISVRDDIINSDESFDMPEGEDVGYTININSRQGVLFLGVPEAGVLLVVRSLAVLE
ncbi:MAG: hypothetical protein ACLFST_13110 [Spirochaetia bacterium]